MQYINPLKWTEAKVYPGKLRSGRLKVGFECSLGEAFPILMANMFKDILIRWSPHSCSINTYPSDQETLNKADLEGTSGEGGQVIISRL